MSSRLSVSSRQLETTARAWTWRSLNSSLAKKVMSLSKPPRSRNVTRFSASWVIRHNAVNANSWMTVAIDRAGLNTIIYGIQKNEFISVVSCDMTWRPPGLFCNRQTVHGEILIQVKICLFSFLLVWLFLSIYLTVWLFLFFCLCLKHSHAHTHTHTLTLFKCSLCLFVTKKLSPSDVLLFSYVLVMDCQRAESSLSQSSEED